jgi:hypothetical protein
MTRRRKILATFVAVTAAIVGVSMVAAPASATPTTASFTTTQTAPLTVTVDSSATVCPWGFCSSSWRYYTATTNRLGVTMGNGSPLTYRFPEAGVYSIVLTYSVRCFPASARWCPATASQSVAVT